MSHASEVERLPLPAAVSDTGVVVVIRTTRIDQLEAVADTLVEAGLSCLELTTTMPASDHWLARLRDRYEASATIGAGTVVSAQQARTHIDAGAMFVVSPTLALDVLEECRSKRVACLPGAFTPTEAWTAWTSGASAVKLFPASTLGAGFVTDLLGPFPSLAVVPTGGIALDQAASWIRAGATAIGVGGALLQRAFGTGDLHDLARSARRLAAEVASARH
jgi:2-dehydro-3-deoxyphosphogluconate aldolase / (4S)-4-hydroxy-2-oxoglutarate aldolase